MNNLIIIDLDSQITVVSDGSIRGRTRNFGESLKGKEFERFEVLVSYPGNHETILFSSFYSEGAKAALKWIADDLKLGNTVIDLSKSATLRAYDEDDADIRKQLHDEAQVRAK